MISCGMNFWFKILSVAGLVCLFGGCASSQDSAQTDAMMIRSVTTSMSSAANNFPANLPR